MVIIDLIRELMYQQNLTVEDLVIKTKITHEIIEEIITRKIMPSPKNAKIILKVLGVDLEDVLILY